MVHEDSNLWYENALISTVKDKAGNVASAVKDKVAGALSSFNKGKSKLPMEYNLQFLWIGVKVSTIRTLMADGIGQMDSLLLMQKWDCQVHLNTIYIGRI